MSEAPRIHLDANVFIYALESQDDEVRTASQSLLAALSRAPRRGVTIELTLAEVLVRPEREGDADLKRRYLDLLTRSKVVELRPLGRSILIESARYRAVSGADQPGPDEPKPDRRNFLADAMRVVTAIESGCTIFVARDRRIRMPQGLRRVAPDRQSISELVETLR